MLRLNRFPGVSRLHLIFEASLWLKALFALSECAAGAAAYFMPQRFLLALVFWVTKGEFDEDPHDLVANFLLHAVQHLSVDAQEFAAVYLLGHGMIKLWLISGLLRQRLWYYPVSIAAFGLFMAYQLYRYTYTHSIWLLLITVLDAAVIALAWHEYQCIKHSRAGWPP